MNRRWSCRLGIRLESQSAPMGGSDSSRSITVIKEICKDTLAERDGRLIPGDRVLMVSCVMIPALSDGAHFNVQFPFFSTTHHPPPPTNQINDEIVDMRNTQEIIDMMRIIRGPLCITVARKIES